MVGCVLPHEYFTSFYKQPAKFMDPEAEKECNELYQKLMLKCSDLYRNNDPSWNDKFTVL